VCLYSHPERTRRRGDRLADEGYLHASNHGPTCRCSMPGTSADRESCGGKEEKGRLKRNPNLRRVKNRKKNKRYKKKGTNQTVLLWQNNKCGYDSGRTRKGQRTGTVEIKYNTSLDCKEVSYIVKLE